MKLHAEYSHDEAVLHFAGPHKPVDLCDAQFVSLPDAILCFFTLGSPERSPHLSSPSVVTWCPANLRYDPTDRWPWFPSLARETGGSGGGPRRTHHIFLRGPEDTAFLYAGPAHLGSYGGSPDGLTADFYLKSRLPRDAWLRLGGYAGWLVEVNHESHLLAPGDSDRFGALLSDLFASEFSHLSMTRYEEDSLCAHTNSRCAWFMYLRYPEDPGLYLAPRPVAEESRQEEFRCGCGIALEFPAAQTASLEEAAEILAYFFRTGTLLQVRNWVEQ